MGVQQYEDLSKDVKKLFKLDTKNTSYVIAVVDDEQFLGHVYYGQKLNDYHLDHLLRIVLATSLYYQFPLYQNVHPSAAISSHSCHNSHSFGTLVKPSK